MKRKKKRLGRPRTGRTKKTLSAKLDLRVIAYLDTCPNKARAIEEAVVATEGYQRWRLAPHVYDVPEGYRLPEEGE